MCKLKSSEDWCKEKCIELGKDILDPDGWDRSNFNKSWNEEIEEVVFNHRVMMSTCNFNKLIIFK